jgi:hypothetical protein
MNTVKSSRYVPHKWLPIGDSLGQREWGWLTFPPAQQHAPHELDQGGAPSRRANKLITVKT